MFFSAKTKILALLLLETKTLFYQCISAFDNVGQMSPGQMLHGQMLR